MRLAVKKDMVREMIAISKFTAIFVPLGVIFYVISNSNVKIVTLLLAAVCGLTILKNPFKGFCIYIAYIILNDDFPLQGPLFLRDKKFASIYYTSVGPFPVVMILLLGLIFIVLMQYALKKKDDGLKLQGFDIKVFLFSIGLIPFVLLSTKNLSNGLPAIISDIYPFFYFLAFYIVSRSLVTDQQKLLNVLRVVIAAVTAKILLCFVLFLMGLGTPFEDEIIKVTFDSGIRYFPIVVFGGLVSLELMRMDESPLRFCLLAAIIFVGTFTIIIMSARLLMVTTLIGLLFLPQNALSMKNKMLSLCLVGLGFLFLLIVNPDMSSSLQRRLHDFFQPPLLTEPSAAGGTSAAVRIVEALNVFNKLENEKSLLWGAGAGSWFDDRYFPFEFAVAEWDFDERTLETGRIYQPHFPWVFVFFKMGLIGVIMHLFLFISVFKFLRTRIRAANNSVLIIYYYAMFGTFISLVVSFHTSKIYSIMGLLAGLLALPINTDRIHTISPNSTGYPIEESGAR